MTCIVAPSPVIETIKAAFPQNETNVCIASLNDDLFHVFDSEQKRCLIQNDPAGKKHFTVENPTGRELHFLAIDKCLFMDSDDIERCDFAVFDAKTFCFAEIKEIGKINQLAAANRKAKDQLKSTIRAFQEKMTFTTKRIEAYLCVGNATPRPARRTNDISERLEFEDMGVELYRGNLKRFA